MTIIITVMMMMDDRGVDDRLTVGSVARPAWKPKQGQP